MCVGAGLEQNSAALQELSLTPLFYMITSLIHFTSVSECLLVTPAFTETAEVSSGKYKPSCHGPVPSVWWGHDHSWSAQGDHSDGWVNSLPRFKNVPTVSRNIQLCVLLKRDSPGVCSSYVTKSVSWIWLLMISLDLGSFGSSMLILELLS